jgi:hypothetical protein
MNRRRISPHGEKINVGPYAGREDVGNGKFSLQRS